MRKFLILTGLVVLLAACSVQPEPRPAENLIEPSAGSWQQLGNGLKLGSNQANEPSQALDNKGYPVVAWQEINSSGVYSIYVKRWNGTTWVQLGNALNVNVNQSSFHPSLALDLMGNPTVTWQAWANGSNNIYVKRWDGTKWIQLGGILDIVPTNEIWEPRVIIDKSGNPIVAWQELTAPMPYGRPVVYVKRWNGTAWVKLGDSLSSIDGEVVLSNLVLDNSGNPVVGLKSGGTDSGFYIKRWNGTTWVQLVNKISYAWNFALDKSNYPVVTWGVSDGIGISTKLYVSRWNGSSWIQLGNDLNVNINQRALLPSLALDTSGNPVVAWSESKVIAVNDENIYVKRWNGNSWVQLGTSLNLDPKGVGTGPDLSLDSMNNPVVSWAEMSTTFSTNVYVKKYISMTDPWTFLGTSALTMNSNTIDANVALRGNDRPVVAWSTYSTDRTKATLNLKEWNGTSWVSVASLGNLPSTFFAMATRSKANSTNMSIDPIGFSWKSETAKQFTVSVRIYNLNAWQTIPPLIRTKTLSGWPISDYRLALDKSGAPVIAWLIRDSDPYYSAYVARWNGSAWVQLGGVAALRSGSFGYGETIDLEIDPLNRPVVATLGYVSRWNGSAWVKLGNGGASWSPQIAFIGNEPVISSVVGKSSSSNRDPASVTVSRWNGSSWVNMGILDVTSDKPAGIPYIAVDSLSRPVVTWYEQDGTSYNMYVKRWNGTGWTLFGNRLDKVLSNKVLPLDVFAKSNNQVIVSWFEAGNIYFKQR